MADWLWLLLVALVVVAAIGVLFMRRRSAGVSGDLPVDDSRNYRDEREDNRVGGMSDEDRAWETASLERNREAQRSDASKLERD